MYPHVRQLETERLEIERELRLRAEIHAARAGAGTPTSRDRTEGRAPRALTTRELEEALCPAPRTFAF